MRDSRFFRFTLFALTAVILCVTADQSHAQSKGRKKGTTAPADRSVLRTSFGSVSLEEFEAAYRRMNNHEPYRTTLDSLLEFLDVYADYRLKLQDAKEQGLDKDPKIQQEIQGYRDMLAAPYLLEKELTEPAIRALYEKRKWENHVSHFLAKINNPKDPADTLRAYNKAMKAMRRIQDGATLQEVVLSSAGNALFGHDDKSMLSKEANPAAYTDGEIWDGTDDKTSARSGGDLGYFTGGMTVRPFENTVYALNPGETTPQPIRTPFGYHIIKLHDRVPRIGGVKVSHILINASKIQTDTIDAYRKADSVYKLLLAGADFAELAKAVSDDKMTVQKGGDMGFINREERRIPEAHVDQAIYSLKDGEMSGVVRSSFGYHIFKRTGTIPCPTFEEEKDKLKQLYKRYYFEEDKNERIDALKKGFGFKIDSSMIDYFLARVDTMSTSIDTSWSAKLTSNDRARTIFTVKGKNWTIGALVDSLNAAAGTSLARQPLLGQLEKYSDEYTLYLASQEIGVKYPEFETIMQDYRNGIILFELENQRVWTRAIPDSTGVRRFYEDNRMKFLWPERVDVSEIFVMSDSLAKALYKRIMAGESFDSLAKQYTERQGFKEKAGRWGILMKEENELAKKAMTFMPEEVKEPFRLQGGYSIVRLNRKVPAMQKTFEEARQEAASQYQEQKSQELRKAWVAELRDRYKRELNTALLTKEWQQANPARN